MTKLRRRDLIRMMPAAAAVGALGVSGCSTTPTSLLSGPTNLFGRSTKLSEQRQLKIKVFPGGFNLPLWAAEENGFFEKRNIDLQIALTRSSVEQISEIMSGEQDIGITAMDNVIAYQEGQGAVSFDAPTDLFAFMGGDNAFLSLVVQDDIRTYDDLRGRTLSVDALTTGFAFVLRRMLEQGGLSEDDYTLVSAGGVSQRWDQLVAGDHAGTLVLTPFELFAEDNGLRVLQSADEVIPDYQGLVGVARRSWAQQNDELLTAFIAGYLDGLDWLYDDANREAVGALLARNVPSLPEHVSDQTLGIFLAEQGGFHPTARMNMSGVETVMGIRSQYASPSKELSDPRQYMNLAYYENALSARLNWRERFLQIF